MREETAAAADVDLHLFKLTRLLVPLLDPPLLEGEELDEEVKWWLEELEEEEEEDDAHEEGDRDEEGAGDDDETRCDDDGELEGLWVPLAPVVDVPTDEGLGKPPTLDLMEEDEDEERIELVLRAFLCGFLLPDRPFDEALLLLLLLPPPPPQVSSLLIGWSVGKADVISQSEPEWEPGGVGGRASALDDDGDGDGQLGNSVGKHCPLLLGVLVEFKSAASVTFLTPEDELLFDLRFALSNGLLLWFSNDDVDDAAFAVVDDEIGEDEIKLPPNDDVPVFNWLPIPPVLPFPPPVKPKLNCIALDIGMHGKHSASMSIASAKLG